MEMNLSTLETKALTEFLEIVNKVRFENKEKQMMPKTALKFLMARKFDVRRSLELYQSHENIRIREGLVKFDPLNEPLKSELDTGKFTILPVRDKNGCTLALFSAGKHLPSDTSHQTTLQGVAYQLDVALDDIDTQRAGIVFIYNMSGAKYAHFDYELSQKILSLLKGAYPARLKKVLIVNAPIWFKAPFRILQLFIREKLRDRVHIISQATLHHHVPIEAIPQDLSGMLKIEHTNWLEHCLKVHEKDIGDLCPTTPSSTKLLLANYFGDSRSMSSSSASSSANSSPRVGHRTPRQMPSDDNGIGKSGSLIMGALINGDNSTTILVNNGSGDHLPEAYRAGTPTNNAPVCLEGIDVSIVEEYEEIEDDIDGLPLAEYMGSLAGKKELYDEYFCIKSTPPVGTFDVAKMKINLCKNRYVDVLCYDHSRVKLPLSDPSDPTSDYINANYVDGFRQKRAFISTQGPLNRTYHDFWRCVWYNKTLVIVMTTRTTERGKTKCGQYWPLEEKTYCTIGNFCIVNESIEQEQDWVISHLKIRNRDTGEERTVVHMLFNSWPDFGVPQSALAMLEFRKKVRECQKQQLKSIEWRGHPLGPPIIVHCSAGIGRTGTFITIDISIQRLEARGRIDIRRTVEKIRSQRAFSIQMPDQYIFCCLALIEFAVCNGMIGDIDLSKFEGDDDDED